VAERVSELSLVTMATIVTKLCVLCEVCAPGEEMVVQLRWNILTEGYWSMLKKKVVL
jgi:hypothetical protein